MDIYCNNCGRSGHLFSHCKLPITSIGIIAFRKNVDKYEYLLIRRKETLGFIDFIRGKYSLNDKKYILNMMRQMTQTEKRMLLEEAFETIWNRIWCDDVSSSQYRSEEMTSKDKFEVLCSGVYMKGEFYNMASLLDECKDSVWEVPEWGFPKGRRNPGENDYDCAIREFCEETGYKRSHLNNLENIIPIEEIFTGSNYKSYKHKYFIMNMDIRNTTNLDNYQRAEVSKMEWMDYEQCLLNIRDYNLEKKRAIGKVNNMLKELTICVL